MKQREKGESEQQGEKKMEQALVGQGFRCHRFALKL